MSMSLILNNRFNKGSKMKQSAAVAKVTIETMISEGLDFTNEQPVKTFLKEEGCYETIKAQVVSTITDMIFSDEVEVSKTSKIWVECDGDQALFAKKYVSGMVDNHFRKHAELRGPEAYQAKNPGSRSRNPQIVAARAMLARATTDEQKAEINAVIESLKAADAAKRATKSQPKLIEENVPAELAHLLSDLAS